MRNKSSINQPPTNPLGTTLNDQECKQDTECTGAFGSRQTGNRTINQGLSSVWHRSTKGVWSTWLYLVLMGYQYVACVFHCLSVGSLIYKTCSLFLKCFSWHRFRFVKPVLIRSDQIRPQCLRENFSLGVFTKSGNRSGRSAALTLMIIPKNHLIKTQTAWHICRRANMSDSSLDTLTFLSHHVGKH